MAYKYQQNIWEGASYGYVKYDISPDFGTPVSAGTTITITGQAYFKNRVNKTASGDLKPVVPFGAAAL